MTRSEALIIAINHMNKLDNSEEIVKALEGLLAEQPWSHWTQNGILDAFQQWRNSEGYFPTVKRLDSIRKLPTHSTIKHHFQLNYYDFLRRYMDDAKINIMGHGAKTREEWEQLFAKEYLRIRPTCAREFNKYRSAGTPNAESFARRFTNDKRYLTWLKQIGLPIFRKERKEPAVRAVRQYGVKLIHRKLDVE